MSTVPPLISVIIPSYNSAFIRECVDSVLAQTFNGFELVIVDCSTDRASIEYVEEIKHPKVKVFRRPERHLPGSNRNFGIERATGEYIVCLDADDIIEPTFLEEALFVICCVDYALVGTSFRLIGVIEKATKIYAHPTIEQVVNGDAFVVTIVMRRVLWEQLGGFRDHALGKEHIPEDWDFFVRAVTSGAKLYNRGSYGFHYRKHFDSLTAQSDMPSLEEMRTRILKRHGEKLLDQPVAAEQVNPKLTKDGWKQLLLDDSRADAELIILPEQINDHFCSSLQQAVEACDQQLIVLSTCEMETYSGVFLHFLANHKALLFSLPDFLEQSELWLEFIAYINASRNVTDIWYGQNPFIVDNLSRLQALSPGAKLHYISRYVLDASRPNSGRTGYGATNE